MNEHPQPESRPVATPVNPQPAEPPSADLSVPSVSAVTRILSAIEQGDPGAAGQLLPLVYDELRRLAAAQMAREKPGHTLDATALVHEAWMRLAGGQAFESRSYFFRASAEAMRRILVDHARARGAEKRGGR